MSYRHYNDVIMSAMASQITSLTMFYSIFYSGADQRIYQRLALLVFVRGIHQWPMNSPHKEPVTRKMFSFDDVIMVMVDRSEFKVYLVFHLGPCRDSSHTVYMIHSAMTEPDYATTLPWVRFHFFTQWYLLLNIANTMSLNQVCLISAFI